tara:strand:+ start:6377 stop:6913 length:537 start_codon:yes stop_codon:yes gene_type:complete
MGELSRTELSFEKAVKKAFIKSKKDISSNSNTIVKLSANFGVLKQEIELLKQNQLNLGELVRKNNEKMTILVDQIDKLLSRHPSSSNGTSSKGSERVPIEMQLVKQFQKNKSRIVKNKVITLLETKEFSAYELYVLIVEQQGLCGKTSFYRYLKDLEKNNRVKIKLQDSQRILTLSKT